MSCQSAQSLPIEIIGIDSAREFEAEGITNLHPQLLNADRIYCGKRIFNILRCLPQLREHLCRIVGNIDCLGREVADLQEQGARIIVLADGDPMLFGIGATLARYARNLSVCPAVSAMQQACAHEQLAWHNLACVSLHGRDDLLPLYNAIRRNCPVCIYTDPVHTPAWLARHLVDRGVNGYSVCIHENMGSPKARIDRLSLSECADFEGAGNITMLLKPEKRPVFGHIGLCEKNFLGSYATKKPVRGTILELLELHSDSICWDIGSGSGILAIEMGSIAWQGQIFAIERKSERCLDIQENRARAAAINVEIGMGQAPQCLLSLPDPDRVFVGGGLSDAGGEEILNACLARLKPGGKLVAAALLLATVQLCRSVFAACGWPFEIYQIQASKNAALGQDVYMAPMNPVYLFGVQKP